MCCISAGQTSRVSHPIRRSPARSSKNSPPPEPKTGRSTRGLLDTRPSGCEGSAFVLTTRAKGSRKGTKRIVCGNAALEFSHQRACRAELVRMRARKRFSKTLERERAGFTHEGSAARCLASALVNTRSRVNEFVLHPLCVRPSPLIWAPISRPSRRTPKESLARPRALMLALPACHNGQGQSDMSAKRIGRAQFRCFPETAWGATRVGCRTWLHPTRENKGRGASAVQSR